MGFDVVIMGLDLRDLGTTAVFAALFVIVATWWISSRDATGIPGPWFTLPLIGETVELMRSSPTVFFWKRLVKYKSLIFRINALGMTNVVVVGDSAAIRSSVWRDDETFEFYVPGKSFMKIVNRTDHMYDMKMHSVWKRLFMTALRPPAVNGMVPELKQVIQDNVAGWISAGRVCASAAGQKLGLDLALDIVADVKIPEGKDRQWAMDTFCAINKALYGVPLNLPGTLLHKGLKVKKEAVQAYADQLRKDLDDLNTLVNKAGGPQTPMDTIVDFVEASSGTPLRLTHVQALSAVPFQEGGLTVEQAADRIVGNMIAASDTTRHLLVYLLAATGLLPTVREKMRQEQEQLVQEYGPELTPKVLSAASYLDSVIRETTRLLSPSNGGFRRTKRPVQLCGYTLPAGTIVWYQVQLMHLLDSTLAGPEQLKLTSPQLPVYMDFINHFEEAFQPERWLKEDKPKQIGTFGGGTHLCTGINLVYAEMKLLLSTLVRQADWCLEDKDMLKKFVGQFPGPTPGKDTDWIKFTPLEKPMPVA